MNIKPDPVLEALSLEGLITSHVETIVTDMWKAYHALAAKYFPGRFVVVDKFHVVRMANNGLDIVRKAVGRSRTREEKILLKDDRWLLYKRNSALTDEERTQIAPWLKHYPDLRKTYDIKERFFDIYDAPDRQTAGRAIDRCFQSIPLDLDPVFVEMTTAVRNWREPILNYFDAPATNAYTESFNALIRQLDRLGRGYSFEVMRARLLYDETVRTKRTSIRARPAPPPATTPSMGYFDMRSSIDGDEFSELYAMLTSKSPVGGRTDDEIDDTPDMAALAAKFALEPDFEEDELD